MIFEERCHESRQAAEQMGVHDDFLPVEPNLSSMISEYLLLDPKILLQSRQRV